jgi:hypothetical protein
MGSGVFFTWLCVRHTIEFAMTDPNPLIESALAAAALASAIVVLGVIFLLILRTSKAQYSLRFLVLTVTCVAAVIGIWTVFLRHTAVPDLIAPGLDVDVIAPIDNANTPAKTVINRPSDATDDHSAEHAAPDDPAIDEP